MHGTKAPCSAPMGAMLGGPGFVPLCPNPRTAIPPSQELAQKNTPHDPATGTGCRGSQGHRAPLLPLGVLLQALGTGGSPGCHIPSKSPPGPMGSPPPPYLLPLLALSRLDKPSQEKGQNPGAAGPAPHGGGRYGVWTPSSHPQGRVVARVKGGDTSPCRLLPPRSPTAEK